MPGSWLGLAAATVVGFFVGAINPATMVATVLKGDLRQGSGNPGATNVGRILGVKWGVVVGALDVVKGLLPTLLALWLLDRFTAYAVGLAVVLGHVLSPFLRGRGGKGVATSLGAVLAVLPGFALIMVMLFALLVWRTRWVAGASLVAALVLALLSGFAPVPEPVLAGRVWGLIIAGLVVSRHHRNIRNWVAQRRP